MGLVRDDLDIIQSRLQDNEQLWTRDELLRYYNDGYRNLLSKSGCVTRMTILDVPGRFTFTYCYDWEVNLIKGTSIKIAYQVYASSMASTYLWESQQLAGTVPVNSQYGVTQMWEIAMIAGSTDHHFTFALPKSHDHIKRIAWDDQELYPVSVRELDTSDRIWYYAPGEPSWWTAGVGMNRTFEIYEIRTDYSQGYELMNGAIGCPRQLSGDRDYSISDALTFAIGASGDITYGGEGEEIAMVFGTIRDMISPDRQYLPMMSGSAPKLILGIIRDFKSSVKSVMVHENVIPDIKMQEQDSPDLIPPQMQKYLRYYVLSTAYAKQGEGERPDLADHYMARFKRGVLVMNRISRITGLDQMYRREEITEVVVRPPRVRLPVHYPPVLY